MVTALTAADIDCPIYISVQWDERNARLHPEWRLRSPVESRFDPDQLQAGWHTLCLNHKAYREQLLAHAREVARTYPTPGPVLRHRALGGMRLRGVSCVDGSART